MKIDKPAGFSRAGLQNLLLVFLLFAGMVPAMAQDRTPSTRPVLPFQQDAVKHGNEEQVAIQFYQNREFDKAAELYEQIYEKKSTQYIYSYLFFCYVETREYSKAEKLVKRQQKLDGGSPKYLVDLGYITYREGNPEKSKKQYEEALKKLGPDQQQIFDMANAFIIKGENEYAIRTYQRGSQLLNNTYTFGFEKAAIYERMGDYPKAMEEYVNLLEVNLAYMNTVQDRLQGMLATDVENEKSGTLRKLLLTRTQKDPEKTWYTELLWWYSVQQKDFDLALIQAKALDRRLKENGDRLIQLAGLAISNDHYDVAMDAYQYLIAKGPAYPYHEMSRRELVNTRYLKTLSRPDPLEKELEILEQSMQDELARSEGDPQSAILMKNLAHLEAFYMGKQDEAVTLLQTAIALKGIVPLDQAECKIELADILLFTEDEWEATLLYQQVYKDFKNDVTGQLAKYKNTLLSFYIGEFKWAQAQADILKAATSKLIANDALALSLLISENYDPDSSTIALALYARADLLDYRNREEEALTTLDSVAMQFQEHPILDNVMFKKAQIRQKQGRFAEADSLYALVVSGYAEEVLADEALMKRAWLNEFQLGNAEKAMAIYQELLEKFPGSIYVPEARKRFRTLRGDQGFK
jgi:tetratricopeptide (TPR) repeat protein